MAKERCQLRIKELEAAKEKLEEEIADVSDASGKYETLKSNREKLERQIYKLESKAEDALKRMTFYEKDSCPTCSQPISEEFRETQKAELGSIHEDVSKQMNAGNALLEQFSDRINTLTEMVNTFNKLNQARRDTEQEIRSEKKILEQQPAVVSVESLELCKQKLKEIVTNCMEKVDQKNTASKDIEYYKASVEILKDSGIKAKIISTFIPIMNELINEYLQKFDMFVKFELDEMFNETIKSRNRDTFTYNSFSEGEKSKIDLSILFAWRKIAMSRNSISTNLLIFDETMDRSMDAESVDVFVDILESMEDTLNVIVISHRAIVPELFDRHIKVKLARDFSILDVKT